MRTLTTRRAQPNQQKHELYLKLTTLEMEKSRRQTERDALVKRLHMIEERLNQVIEEQDELNQLLSGVSITDDTTTSVGNPRQAKSDGAFPLQY